MDGTNIDREVGKVARSNDFRRQRGSTTACEERQGNQVFLVAFGAATVLPFQSEPVLIGLLVSGKFSVPGLLIVASVGNILGAVCNWVLGRFIDRFQDRAWFPVKKPSLERASGWYRRYGRWSLLLSWMPLFGDALTVIAGVLREPLWSFLILVTVAKTGRYLVLAALTLGTTSALGF